MDSFQWLKDGRVIDKDSSKYNQTQIITDGSSVTYQHTLSSERKTSFEGRFTCLVRDVYGNSESRMLMLNSKSSADVL